MEEINQKEQRSPLLTIILVSIIIHLIFLLLMMLFEDKTKINRYEEKDLVFLNNNLPIINPITNPNNLIQNSLPENLLPEPVQKEQEPEKIQDKIIEEEKNKIIEDNILDNLPNVEARAGIPEFLKKEISKEDTQDDEFSFDKQDNQDIGKEEVTEDISQNIQDNALEQKSLSPNGLIPGKITGDFASIDSVKDSVNLNNLKNNTNITNDTNSEKPKKRKILEYHGTRPTISKEIMQGFLGDSLTSQYAFSHKSDSNNTDVTSEQFKRLNYINKVFVDIGNAWNIKSSKLKLTNGMFGSSITYHLSLDQKGNIITLEKLKGTGFKNLDDVIMESIAYAAPFNPIPKFLKRNKIDLVQTLYLTSYNKY